MANGIFVGLATVDLIYTVDEFPEANTKVVARSQDLFAGGPATNAAIAFHHLGGSSTLVSVVGRHALASAIKEELRTYSISLIDLNPSFEQSPSISSISVNARGERNVISANATRIATPPAQVDEIVLAQASIMLVDGHSMQACQAWAGAARARTIPVVLDGGSWKDGTRELLASIDTAICSADFRPPGCFTEDDVLHYLEDCGVTNIAITRGADPIRFVSGASSGIVPVPQVDRVDTMGAGDILHGAFCYYSSIGKAFEQALSEAAKVASDSCRFHGTREWMQRGNLKQTARDNSA
jgi:sugar/nucleoside kinase (ribokinase family)